MILVPAVLLSVLVVHVVIEQSRSIEKLSATNRTLAGERLAASLEAGIWSEARLLFDDPLTAEFLKSPAAVEPALAKRHPIAAQLVLMRSGTLEYPSLRVRSRLPESDVDENCRDDFLRGEEREFRANNPAEALLSYRKSADCSTSARSKAASLAAAARCLEKAAQPEGATLLFAKLAQPEFRSMVDPGGRPYALPHLVRTAQPVPPALGISEEAFEFYAPRLVNSAELAERFRTAKIFRDVYAGANCDTLRPASWERDSQRFQFFALRVAGGETLGVAVSFARVRQLLGGGAVLTDRAASQGVAFASLFPFWHLDATGVAAAVGSAERRVLMTASAALAIVALLAAGTWIVLRSVAREAELAKALSDMVNGVTHDLKAPLAAIRVYADILADLRTLAEEERRRVSRAIAYQSGRLANLIDNVLDYSRIDRNAKAYKLQRLDLIATLRDLFDSHLQYWEARGVTVVVSLDSGEQWLDANKDAVTRCVLNLVENAIKYGGEARWVAVRVRRARDAIIIDVEDRGPGIPVGDRDAIFHQFVRRQPDDAVGGYGLGLFLTRHAMRAHHGDISYVPREGGGSIFRLELPICRRS